VIWLANMIVRVFFQYVLLLCKHAEAGSWVGQVREHIRLAWDKEKRICALVWGLGEVSIHMGRAKVGKADPSMFFLQTILVTPNRFRPPNLMDDNVSHIMFIFY
jgi:hypothetical protein